MKSSNNRIVCLKIPQEQIVCHLRAADLETLETRARTAILLWDDHFTVWDQRERGGGRAGRRDTEVSILPEVSCIRVRAVGQTENIESFVARVWLTFTAASVQHLYCKRLEKETTDEQKSLVLLSHHDTAGQWFTFPQAILSEDACQPPATEATHTPRQRVQEPHASGRYQCVWDWERR